MYCHLRLSHFGSWLYHQVYKKADLCDSDKFTNLKVYITKVIKSNFITFQMNQHKFRNFILVVNKTFHDFDKSGQGQSVQQQTSDPKIVGLNPVATAFPD
jgi:hypothetical protein